MIHKCQCRDSIFDVISRCSLLWMQSFQVWITSEKNIIGSYTLDCVLLWYSAKASAVILEKTVLHFTNSPPRGGHQYLQDRLHSIPRITFVKLCAQVYMYNYRVGWPKVQNCCWSLYFHRTTATQAVLVTDRLDVIVLSVIFAKKEPSDLFSRITGNHHSIIKTIWHN